MAFKLNSKTIDISRDLTIGVGDDAITYPAASLQSASLRAELGIIEEADPVRADDRYYWNGDVATPKDLDSLRTTAIAEIKRVRQSALDSVEKSAGVAATYAENIAAANAYKAGTGDTTLMRDGSTAAAYLTAIAAGMGYSVEAFADYVIAENSASAAKAREIEAEYVRLVYTYVPACTFDQVQTVVSDYSAYCSERQALE